jgi:hypothetical protein
MKRFRRSLFAALVLSSLLAIGCPADDDDVTGDDDDTGDDDSAGDDDTQPPAPISFVIAAVDDSRYALVNPDTGDDWRVVESGLDSFSDVALGFPGSKALLVGTANAGGVNDVYICDALDGTDLARVTAMSEPPGATSVDGSAVNEEIVFSAFAYDETSGENRESIFLTDPLGSEITQLTTADEVLTLPGSGVTVISIGETWPNWAPTGNDIVYVAHTVREYAPQTPYDVIVVMDEEGGNKSVIYSQEGDPGFRPPCFFSDSDFVLVTDQDDEGARRVRTVWADYKTYSDVTSSLDLPADDAIGDVACANASTRIVYTHEDDGPLFTALLQFTGTAMLVTGPPAPFSSEDADHGYRIPDWARYSP